MSSFYNFIKKKYRSKILEFYRQKTSFENTYHKFLRNRLKTEPQRSIELKADFDPWKLHPQVILSLHTMIDYTQPDFFLKLRVLQSTNTYLYEIDFLKITISFSTYVITYIVLKLIFFSTTNQAFHLDEEFIYSCN